MTEAGEGETIDERLIAKLLRAFYARVRVDPLIGPIFNERIQDWEPHLARIGDFWSAVMLRTGRYQGQPMRLHLPLPIDATHFDRWLEVVHSYSNRQRRECCLSRAGVLHSRVWNQCSLRPDEDSEEW